MLIKSGRRFDKICSSSLMLLSYQIILLKVIRSEGLNVSETRTIISHSSLGHKATSANYSTTKSRFYPNHRMEPSDDNPILTNSSSASQDRLTSDSILRPQLALQIYTNSPASNNQANTEKSNHQASKPTSTMLILPIPQHNQEDSRQQSTINERRSNENPRHFRELSADKLLPWHYVTEHSTSNSNPSGGFSKSNHHGDGQGKSDDSLTQSSSTPMINAIITVPSSSDERHHHHHHHSQLQQHEDSLAQNSSAYVDKTISQLLDNQASGNIEISMSLNGDEIIINPLSKRGKSGSNTSADTGETLGDIDGDPEQSEDSSERRYTKWVEKPTDFKQNSNKALRKHIISEMPVDQSLASEIDQVDDDDGREDFRESTKDEDPTKPQSGDAEEEPEKNEAERSNKYWINSSPSNSDQSDDENATDESNHQEDRLVKGYSTKKSSTNFDRESRKGSSGDGRQAYNNKAIKPGGRIKIEGKTMRRKTSGSKRRASYKAGDKEESIASNKRISHGEDSDVSSVLVKNEDVKRFEQLLENLRSLTMNNLSLAKSKRVGKMSKQQARNVDQQDTGSRDEEDTSQDTNVKTWKSGESKSTSYSDSPNQMASKQSYSEVAIDTECDRRKRQQQQNQLEKSASGDEPSHESDLSRNIVDQDPMTSNDGGEDLNDEGTQNIEHEDQVNYEESKVSPQSNSDVPATSDQKADKSPIYAEGKPRSLFVRKTILQNYYDNNAKHATGMTRNDDLESIHRAQHEAQHERHANMDNQPDTHQVYPNIQQQQRRNQVQSSRLESNNKEVPVRDTYIDYNQLDDREMNRGKEIEKFKNALPTMRSLQHFIERAAIEGRSKPSANE